MKLTLSKCVDITNAYEKLRKDGKLTKKAICDLVKPFRDKYLLTDIEALSIARGECSVQELNRLIEETEKRTNEKIRKGEPGGFIFAKIRVDDKTLTKYCEACGIELDENGDTDIRKFVKDEMGNIEDNGIVLERSHLVGEGTDNWDRYISYVLQWAFDHPEQDDDDQILTFKEFHKLLKGEKI